jgi:hypothetical protein
MLKCLCLENFFSEAPVNHAKALKGFARLIYYLFDQLYGNHTSLLQQNKSGRGPVIALLPNTLAYCAEANVNSVCQRQLFSNTVAYCTRSKVKGPGTL